MIAILYQRHLYIIRTQRLRQIQTGAPGNIGIAQAMEQVHRTSDFNLAIEPGQSLCISEETRMRRSGLGSIRIVFKDDLARFKRPALFLGQTPSGEVGRGCVGVGSGP